MLKYVRQKKLIIIYSFLCCHTAVWIPSISRPCEALWSWSCVLFVAGLWRQPQLSPIPPWAYDFWTPGEMTVWWHLSLNHLISEWLLTSFGTKSHIAVFTFPIFKCYPRFWNLFSAQSKLEALLRILKCKVILCASCILLSMTIVVREIAFAIH